MSADGKFSEIRLSQAFLEYGLWQDYGTGKEVPRGNSGDLGRPKVRKARHWFSRKYYMSVMNIKEFMADSLGRQFQGIISDALDKKKFSRTRLAAAYDDSSPLNWNFTCFLVFLSSLGNQANLLFLSHFQY